MRTQSHLQYSYDNEELYNEYILKSDSDDQTSVNFYGEAVIDGQTIKKIFAYKITIIMLFMIYHKIDFL